MADKEIKVVLKLDGLQEFRSQLNAVSTSAKNLKSDFSAFGDSLGHAATQMAKIAAAAVAAATAIVSLTLHNAEANDKIVKLSEKTGIATDTLQEYSFIAKQVGVSTDGMSEAFIKLSIGLAQIKTPTQDAEKLQNNLAKAQQALNETLVDTSRSLEKVVKSQNKSKESLNQHNLQIQIHNALNPKHRKELKLTSADLGSYSEAQDKANRSISKAREKVKEALDAITEYDKGQGKLGKTLNDINPKLNEQVKNAKTTEDAFQILIKAMRKMTIEQQNLVAAAAFGKSSVDFAQFARLTNKEIETLITDAHRLGGVIKKEVLLDSVELSDTWDNLKVAATGLSNGFTEILQPALIEIGQALTELIVKNKGPLLAFIKDVVERVTVVVAGLFELFQTGGKSGNVDATARKIYDGFIIVIGAVKNASETLSQFMVVLDKFAKLAGFSSGQTVLISTALLQYTGLIDVAVKGTFLITSALKLFFAVLSGGPQVWAVLLGSMGKFLGIAGLVGTAIFFIIDKTIGWQAALKFLKETLDDVIAGAPIAFELIKNIILNAVESIILAIQQIPIFVKDALGPELIAQWTEIVDALVLGVSAFVEDALVFLLEFVNSDAWNKIVAAGAAAWNALKNGFSGFLISSLSAVTRFAAEIGLIIVNGIVSAFNKLPSLISGVFDTIKNQASGVLNSINNAVGSVKSFITSAPKIPQPRAGFFGPGFAGGGHVQGSGTSQSDSIFARLSNNEFVIQAAAVRKFGVGFLNAINNGMFPKFASGGFVGSSDGLTQHLSGIPSFDIDQTVASGRPFNLILPNGKTIKTRGIDESTAKQLEKELRSSANAKAMDLPEWYK